MATTETDIIRMRLIIQNNRLKTEIEQQFLTLMELSKKVSFSYQTLSNIINLRIVPSESQMIEIAIILKKPIDYLFPESLADGIRNDTFKERRKYLNEEAVKSLPSPKHQLLISDGGINNLEEKLDKGKLKDALSLVVSCLKGRRREIVESVYGLNGKTIMTQADIAIKMGCTRANVNQYLRQALRTLRHPSRSRNLKKFLET